MSSKTPINTIGVLYDFVHEKNRPKKVCWIKCNIKDDVVIICQIKKENKNPAHDEKKRDY